MVVWPVEIETVAPTRSSSVARSRTSPFTNVAVGARPTSCVAIAPAGTVTVRFALTYPRALNAMSMGPAGTPLIR